MSEELETDAIEVFLSTIDKIDPFGRDNLGMTPQQFRRYRVGTALRAALRSATLAERLACAKVIKSAPQFVRLDDEYVSRTGFLVRQTSRDDLVRAVLDRSTPIQD